MPLAPGATQQRGNNQDKMNVLQKYRPEKSEESVVLPTQEGTASNTTNSFFFYGTEAANACVSLQRAAQCFTQPLGGSIVVEPPPNEQPRR